LRKRQEDSANKPAGRYALAGFAGANVQYLLPMQKGGTTEYLIDCKRSLRFTFWAFWNGTAIGPSVESAFPSSSLDRPDSILGFSVIRRHGFARRSVSIADPRVLLDAKLAQ